MNTTLRTITLTAAMLATGSANADSLVFDNSLVNILASAAPDTAIVGGVNSPDPTSVSIDQSTGDYGGSGSSDGLLRFSDYSLPGNVNVISATLSFYTTSSSPGPVSIYQMTTNWADTATWNNFGGDGLTPGVETAATPAASAVDIAGGTPISFDVTSVVSAWAAGADNFGFGIHNASTNGWDFSLITDGDAFKPTLTVNFTPVPIPAALPLMLSGMAAVFGFARRNRRA